MQNAFTTDMHHSTSKGYKPIFSRSLTSTVAGVGVPEVVAFPRIGEVAAVCTVVTVWMVAVDVPVVAGEDPGDCHCVPNCE